MNDEQAVTDPLRSVQHTADRLGLKPSTIRKMILERRIDTVRPSRRAVRVPESVICKILKQGFRPAVADR